MATTASVKRSLSKDSQRSHSRQRYGYGRPPIESGRRSHSRTKRLQKDRSVSGDSHRLPLSRPPPQPTPQYFSQTTSSSPNTNKPTIRFASSNSPPATKLIFAPAMERTLSGDSIISDTDIKISHTSTSLHNSTISDSEAAHLVVEDFHHCHPPSRPFDEDTLLHLLRWAPLTDHTISRIISRIDTLFFHSSLDQRVRWDWSSPTQSRYSSELIGTTALRHASFGGYETLIVLSEPILRSPLYERGLLLSALLHELVHCYLFVKCGFGAKRMDGHTQGFHRVVGVLDEWVGRRCGKGWLRLCSMRANLEYFRIDYDFSSYGREEDFIRGAEQFQGPPLLQQQQQQQQPQRIFMTPLFQGTSPVVDESAERSRHVRVKHGHEGCNHSPGPEQDRGWGSGARVAVLGYEEFQ